MTAARQPRRRTGDAELDRRLVELLDGRAPDPDDRNLLFEMLTTVLRLAGDEPDRLNLKITNAALKEMRQAFRVFAPFHDVPKITIFGSARTRPDDPLYVQTRDLAAALARAGWMVVTGAGPGIMAAGAEGAGRDQSIGVNIRLPFEQDANPFIAADPKLVSMKYFFTRKLMLMKESAGFVVLPGGFGTLDETFELLTLLQTGKAAPAPLVLLEVPSGTYWKAWDDFNRNELVARGLVSPDDLLLYRVTSDADEAVGEILGFYRNYQSLRYVGSHLVIRLKAAPTGEELEELNKEFADIVVDGPIERTPPRPAEVADNDNLDLPRVTFRFDRMNHGRLRALIDAVNRLPGAPPLEAPDARATAAAGTPPDTGGAEAAPTLEPSLAEVFQRAASADEAAVLQAAADLAELLASGAISTAQQDLIAGELFALVLAAPTPPARLALLGALVASSPFVGLDVVLDLLLDHRDRLEAGELAALLDGLDAMLASAEAALAPGGRDQVAVLLRLTSPLRVLDELASSPDERVARAAAEVRDRARRLTA